MKEEHSILVMKEKKYCLMYFYGDSLLKERR